MADIKSMNLEQAKAYQKELKGKLSPEEYSKSKEVGKVVNYIKTLQPEKTGKEDVANAYKQLSSGVTERGGWTEKNLQTIYEQTGVMPQLKPPTSSEDLPGYLDSYQGNLYGDGGNAPATRLTNLEQQLTPNTDMPDSINRVETRESLRAEYGVADLETSLNDLKAQEEEVVALLRQQKSAEQGKPVPMGVIEGRMSEETRQANEQLDYIGRQKSRIIDELNTKYAIIDQYINDLSLDYQDAVKAYEAEFSKNLAIYQLIQTEYNQQQANARANLQIYMNAITKGNLDYNSMSSDQKLLIKKLEVQSGLPAGFTSNLKMDAGANILFTTSNEGITQVGVRNSDGTISVQSYGTRISSGGTKAEDQRNAVNLTVQDLKDVRGKDGYVSPDAYRKQYDEWIRAGFDPETFYSVTRNYVNPTHYSDYNIPAKYISSSGAGVQYQ